MSREGSKSSRSDLAELWNPGFACLQPFLDAGEQELGTSFENLSRTLEGLDTSCRIHVRLVDGDDTVEAWEVGQGTAALTDSGDDADVLVVVTPETWIEIAQGRLAPFDALFGGRLRVGGDLELAKRVTQHLSDPSVPFVPPC